MNARATVGRNASVRTGRAAFRRRRRLRAGLLQLVSVGVGLGLGLLVPEIRRGPVLPSREVAELLFATGFGVLGAATVIFSVLFLVVQWAATTFTPRLTLFRDAPIVWRTFAFVVGLAVFCATAALAVAGREHVSVVVPVAAGVLLLLLLALLRGLLLQAVAAIQLAPVLRSISERGRAGLDALGTSGPEGTWDLPNPASDPPGPAAPRNPENPDDPDPDRRSPAGPGPAPRGWVGPGLDRLRSTVRWPGAGAVLQRVDTDRLAEAARAANAVVVLRVSPGTTLRYDTTVAEVYDGDLPGSAVLRALETGAERVFDQDPELAFRLLADIALRALSPAVNDPATAVQALDAMEDLLRRPVPPRAGPREIADRTGTVRVLVPLPGREDFLRTAFDDVIPAARNSPMVLVHLRTLLRDLGGPDHGATDRQLAGRLAWVEEELDTGFPRLRDGLTGEHGERPSPAGGDACTDRGADGGGTAGQEPDGR
ncbi:DUF2254 family protein [Streptomyces aureus]|uniref:DUF2254 family protein n=1 Tax=Streptomyces aureus TaxID=193461 RepID=UPI00369D5593